MLAGYYAGSTLAIRVTDMEQVGEVIDAAFAAGANTLNGITFSATDTKDAKAKALKAAVEDAREKAEVLAAASDLELLSIESITEGGTFSYDRGVMNNFAKEEAAAGTMDSSTVVRAAKTDREFQCYRELQGGLSRKQGRAASNFKRIQRYHSALCTNAQRRFCAMIQISCEINGNSLI